MIPCHLQSNDGHGRLDMIYWSKSNTIPASKSYLYKRSRQQRRLLHLDIRLTGIYEDHWGHTQQADLGDHHSTVISLVTNIIRVEMY